MIMLVSSTNNTGFAILLMIDEKSFMWSDGQNNSTPLESHSSELFVSRDYNTIGPVLFFWCSNTGIVKKNTGFPKTDLIYNCL